LIAGHGELIGEGVEAGREERRGVGAQVAMEVEEGGHHGGAARGGELGPVLLFMSWLLYRIVEEEGYKKEKEEKRKGRKIKREEKNVEIFSNLEIFSEKYKRQFMGLV
jgi:hypothetical protein